MPHALHFLIFTVAGWLTRRHDDVVDYLREEYRVFASSWVVGLVQS